MQKKEEYKVCSLELTKEEKEAFERVRDLLAEIDKCDHIELFDTYGESIGIFHSIAEMLEECCLEDVLDGFLFNDIKVWEK